jgi:hypothetical protein
MRAPEEVQAANPYRALIRSEHVGHELNRCADTIDDEEVLEVPEDRDLVGGRGRARNLRRLVGRDAEDVAVA